MGDIKLDSALIESSIGVMEKQVNQKVIELVTPLAEVLKNSNDSNRQVTEMHDVAVKFQNQYNEYLESVKEFLKEAHNVLDLADYMEKKATVGDVQNRDVSFDVNKTDTSKIMQ